MLWIGDSGVPGSGMGARRRVFPMALKNFGIEPDRVVFVELSRPKDMLWVMEEALKCEGLAAVVGEIPEISFTASRRLQLAVEQSRVTGFLLRHQPRGPGVNACVARWRVSAMASELAAGLPGVGFPRWNVELLKIRNGRPGVYPVEWAAGRFRAVQPPMVAAPDGSMAGIKPMVAAVPAVGGMPMVAARAMIGEMPVVAARTGAVAMGEVMAGAMLGEPAVAAVQKSAAGATNLSAPKRKAG